MENHAELYFMLFFSPVQQNSNVLSVVAEPQLNKFSLESLVQFVPYVESSPEMTDG